MPANERSFETWRKALHRLFRVREVGFQNGAAIICEEHLRFEAGGHGVYVRKNLPLRADFVMAARRD